MHVRSMHVYVYICVVLNGGLSMWEFVGVCACACVSAEECLQLYACGAGR